MDSDNANGHYPGYAGTQEKLSIEDIFVDIHRMDVTALFRSYLYKIEIYARIIAGFFGIIVFACIADRAYEPGWCVMNASTACDYGIAVGVIALLTNLLFILMDLSIELVIHVTLYKIVVVVVLVFNLLWGFNWFVVFCYMANQWAMSPKYLYYEHYRQGIPIINNVQAAITFAFFSVLIYLVIIILGVMRVLRGSGNILDLSYYQSMWKRAMYVNVDRMLADSESSYHTPIITRLDGSHRKDDFSNSL